MSVLRYESVGVRYGGVKALQDVSFRVEPGAVTGLIGPNGAGKTTLINATTGIVHPTAGAVYLDDRRIDGLAQYAIARAGIARTYQNIRLFGELTVAENIEAGAYRRPAPPDQDALRALLVTTGIEHVALDARAGSLAYGDQRRLEIARAMAASPAVVMLDEPAAGMNPHETHALGAQIRALAAAGAAVLLVEHDMPLVFASCDRVVVLNFGEVIASGTPAEISREPAVVEAYLGTEATA